MDKLKDYIKTLLKLAIQNNPEVLKVVRMAKVENDKWISIKKGDEVVHLPLDCNNKIDTKRIEQWGKAERGIKQELGDKVKKVEVEEPHIAKWKSKKNVDILEGNDNLFVVGQGNNYGIVEDGELVEHYGKYGSYYWSSNKNLILDKYNKLKKSGEQEKYLNAPKSAYTLQKKKNGVGLYRYGDYYKVYKDDNLLYVTDKSDKAQYALEHYTGKYANLYDYDSPEYWDSIQTAQLKKEKGIYNYNPDQKRDKKGRWTKENYNAEIDRILKGELKSADRIKVVEHPSAPWLKAGLQDAEMFMSVKTYGKATTDKHNVSEETMRNLPDLIDDPLYIFKSSTVPGSYVGVLDDYEEENGIKKPLIAVVKPEQGKIDVNLIPSVYGKDPDFPYREVFKNNLLYERLDKNKTVSNNIIASIAMETLKPPNNIITENHEDFNPSIQNEKWISIKKGDEVVHLPLDGNNKIDTKRIEQWKEAEREIKQELGDKVKKVKVEEPKEVDKKEKNFTVKKETQKAVLLSKDGVEFWTPKRFYKDGELTPAGKEIYENARSLKDTTDELEKNGVEFEPSWESEKAYGVDTYFEDYNGKLKPVRVFIPKSQIMKNGNIPLWLFKKKIEELNEKVGFAANKGDYGSGFKTNFYKGEIVTNSKETVYTILDGELYEFEAEEFNPISLNSKTAVQNYNQNQPRVTKGNPNGGQFAKNTVDLTN